MNKHFKRFITCAVILSSTFSFFNCISDSTTQINAASTNNTTGFVTTDGIHFMLNDEPFYFAGCNSYDLFTLGDGSNDSSTDRILSLFMNQEKIEERFKLMAKNGVTVCRTWGFSSEEWHGFETAPGKYSEAQFMLFDYIMQCADKYNIKIIITLENFWDAYGGIDEKLKWAGMDYGNYKARCEWFTNSDCQKWYKDYINHFVNRVNYFTGVAYKDDPNIFAWDLMNEPRYEDFSAEENRSGKTLRKWVDDVGKYLKSLDSNHMVCAGIEGHETKYGFGGYEGNPFVYLQQSPYIDFCSAHPYPSEMWAGLSPDDNAKLVKAWIKDAHEVVGKPIVIGEFNAHSYLSYEEYANYWHSVYDTVLDEDAGGALFWEFNTQRLSPFTVMDGDEILDYFKEMSDKMKAKCGQSIQQPTTPTQPSATDKPSTPTISPSDDPSLDITDPVLQPTIKPSDEPFSDITNPVTPSSQPTNPSDGNVDATDMVDVTVTSEITNSVSQKYTIKTSTNNKNFDLSKLTIRYYFSKSDNKNMAFTCDNAGISLNKAPYYVDYSKNIIAKFYDNYLEITFDKSYELNEGTLNMGTRFYNTDWSTIKDFNEGIIEILYNK